MLQNSSFAHSMYSRFVPFESQNKQPLFRYHCEHVGLCNGNALFFVRQEVTL
jgi:hypothetical protein